MQPCRKCLLIAITVLVLLPQPVRADTQDQQLLRELISRYEETVNRTDPSALESDLDNEFTCVMITGDRIDGLESLGEYWRHVRSLIGEQGRYEVKVTVAEPIIIEGNVAVARGSTEDRAVTASGREYQFGSEWTAVCRRQNGQWKLLRLHGSMNPINNAFVAAASRGSMMFGGGLGGLLGLVFGALAMGLWIQRRIQRRGRERGRIRE